MFTLGPQSLETALWRTLQCFGSFSDWSLPVLAYHSIDVQGDLCAIDTRLFRQHLQYLNKHRYIGLKCSDLMASLDSRGRPRVMALTFDDGYNNFVRTALPLLKEFGYTATVFPVVNKIEGVSDWGRLKGVPIRGLMSWSEIKYVAQQGIEIGSHGLEHRYLPECSGTMLEREIKESKSRLEQYIGQEVSTFCYPYGAYNETVLGIVKAAGYRQACTSRYDICKMGTRPLEIPRISMDIFNYHGQRGMKIFPACLNGGSRPYIMLRNFIKRPPQRFDRPDGI